MSNKNKCWFNIPKGKISLLDVVSEYFFYSSLLASLQNKVHTAKKSITFRFQRSLTSLYVFDTLIPLPQKIKCF